MKRDEPKDEGGVRSECAQLALHDYTAARNRAAAQLSCRELRDLGSLSVRTAMLGRFRRHS